jgi:glycerophosphoryl diester phosphodiesterase
MRSRDESCRIFGHGSGAAGDELNSRASFERVRTLGCTGVELDVRRTHDGALAVVHDAILPDGRDVATTPAAELPDSIPLLEEILDALSGIQVNVEIKNHRTDPHWDPGQRTAKQVVAMVAARGHSDDVLVSCFGPECLTEVRGLDPRLPTAQLLLSRRPTPDLLDAVVADGHEIVHPYDTMVDAAFMTEARARGLRVHAWTAEDDSPERLAALITLGIEGLITGAPEVALDLIRAR